MSWTLIQTEKSYNLQTSNVFAITCSDKNLSTNKIEMQKKLLKKGLKPIKITSVSPYQKLKKRGKGRNLVAKFRPRKWYISLPEAQKITDETLQDF